MDVTKKLAMLLEDRGWSEYRLAKESNLPHSTVLNIFQRNNLPSISTLEAMCNGLGITLAQFFTCLLYTSRPQRRCSGLCEDRI